MNNFTSSPVQNENFAISESLPERREIARHLDVQFSRWGYIALKSRDRVDSPTVSDMIVKESHLFDFDTAQKRFEAARPFSGSGLNKMVRSVIVNRYGQDETLDHHTPESSQYAYSFNSLDEQLFYSFANNSAYEAFAAIKRLYIVRENVAPFRRGLRDFNTTHIQQIVTAIARENPVNE